MRIRQITVATIITLLFIAAVVGGRQYLFMNDKAPFRSDIQKEPYVAALDVELKGVLATYRKIIVLLADENTLSGEEKVAVNRIGHKLFHDNRARIARLEESFDALTSPGYHGRFEALDTMLTYMESDPSLYDADRLAFRELLQTLQADVARDSSLPAIKIHKRISEDLDALSRIEHNYEKEIRQIFGRFGQRAIELKREKWADYVAHLKQIYSREQIIKDYADALPDRSSEPDSGAEATKQVSGEIYGAELPKKTLVLTFDDGPHTIYTEEIMAILKQYSVPAVFFSVGRNMGAIDNNGKVKLSSRAEVSRKLKASGFVLANHSFSHTQLSKESDDSLKAEILNTDALLKVVDANRSPLFRFPYGARNRKGLEALATARLTSVLWNIDSLDWADPVPTSIADRVLRTVDKEGRGIILFHDIHERAIKALPIILDRLTADGYQFAAWDGNAFTVAKKDATSPEKTVVSTDYSGSWAIVIGIDDYAKWPKLQYAARDASAMRLILTEKLGFPAERILTFINAEATRAGILSAFHDKLAHGGVKKNDRIFVFFAGHGATRNLSSGRDLGYIVPVDSDPNQFATDAIPMTEIQNIAESLSAKHVLFVMDACYSGLGLTRGAGSASFLRDNAKRIGRQMLTAGGGDQLVADSGPNGHSVFTWTLLQALGGKGDLNGDGLITATELAAYVAPAVSSVSSQTPAFGSLPGSEGGDFIFELPNETEFISTQTAQLSTEAISLNTKLDASRVPTAAGLRDKPSAKTMSVTVMDLQGGKQKILPPPPTAISMRQLAQRANDRGLQLYKEKHYAAAEAQFSEAIKRRPDFSLAANNLGFVYYKQEKYREAVQWFENAVKMDPSRAIAYLNLGDTYARIGENDKAKISYRTYIELAPNGSRAVYAKQQLDKL